MTAEEKHKINVWCPGGLWKKKVEALGYDSPTKAVITAFEKLIEHQGTGKQPGRIRKQSGDIGKQTGSTISRNGKTIRRSTKSDRGLKER